jgi:hypothetical protein
LGTGLASIAPAIPGLGVKVRVKHVTAWAIPVLPGEKLNKAIANNIIGCRNFKEDGYLNFFMAFSSVGLDQTVHPNNAQIWSI